MDLGGLEGMGTGELERLVVEAEEVLARRRAGDAGSLRARGGNEVVGRRGYGSGRGRGRWLQLERVRCGKGGCKKCSGEGADGRIAGHGPYWYLYRPNPDTGRLTSEYVGKALPEELRREFPEKAQTALDG